jgi:hypothetical protein
MRSVDSKFFNFYKWRDLQKEINKNRIAVDRKVFEKSFQDRTDVSIAKSSYKSNFKTSKFESGRAELAEQIIKASVGRSKLNVVNFVYL